MILSWTGFATIGLFFAQQPAPESANVKYTVALTAAIASIIVALISALFSVIGLVISRRSQSALQRQQAELTQNNQKELESLKAQLALRTQSELEKAKAALSENGQTRLEELKKELEGRSRVAGFVGDNRFKAAQVLTTGYKSVATQIYAYQHIAEQDGNWATTNRQGEKRRIASLLQKADDEFQTYTLYFDGLTLKEIATVYADLMAVIINDVDNKERLNQVTSRMSILFTLLREELGIKPLSLNVDAILKSSETHKG